MLTLLETLLLLSCIAISVPCSVIVLQVLSTFLPARNLTPLDIAGNTEAVTTCILMPAHNEASGIRATINALLPHLNERTHLLVVADNCADETASIVREVADSVYPIEVVERTHLELRGKGYALDFGVRHLERRAPPQAVVILDADCVLTSGSLSALVQRCLRHDRPTQALYLMQNQPGPSTKKRLAEFAWVVKNKVRPLGSSRLGLPCQLMGTGMAFTWQQISQASLASGHLVEDMQLGLELARKGAPPIFCPETLVTSYFPVSVDGANTQRTRWEHGHLGLIANELPALLMQSIRNKSIAMFAMALDFCVPPLALLGLCVAALCTSTFTFWWLTGVGALAFQIAFALMLLLSMTLVLAWVRFGQSIIGFRQLCSVPLYIAGKIPIYLLFLMKRQVTWVRSKRDGEQ